MQVAFLGLGIMGSRMAKNLLSNKVEVTVYNRTKSVAESLSGEGAKVASSSMEAVRNADVVFTMVSNPTVVEALAKGESGFLQAMKPNALWVDCTTVNPSFSLESAAWAKETGVRFLEAPVAGSKPHAEQAQLVFFVGGEEAYLEEVQPLMEYMGRKVLYVGEQGKGSSLKMLVNGMLAQSMLVFAEAVKLGEAMGLDVEFLMNFLPNLPVIAPFVKAKVAMMQTGEYEAEFPLELMQKDLHLVCQTAYELGHPLWLANLTKEVFAGAKQAGKGREDFSAVYAYLKGI